jgi:hypothetical protein
VIQLLPKLPILAPLSASSVTTVSSALNTPHPAYLNE